MNRLTNQISISKKAPSLAQKTRVASTETKQAPLQKRHHRNAAIYGSTITQKSELNDNPQDSAKRLSMQPLIQTSSSFVATDQPVSKPTSPCNLQSDSFHVEGTIANQLHKSRYLSKVYLQICALLSQLGKHQDALLAA